MGIEVNVFTALGGNIGGRSKICEILKKKKIRTFSVKGISAKVGGRDSMACE